MGKFSKRNSHLYLFKLILKYLLYPVSTVNKSGTDRVKCDLLGNELYVITNVLFKSRAYKQILSCDYSLSWNKNICWHFQFWIFTRNSPKVDPISTKIAAILDRRWFKRVDLDDYGSSIFGFDDYFEIII